MQPAMLKSTAELSELSLGFSPHHIIVYNVP